MRDIVSEKTRRRRRIIGWIIFGVVLVGVFSAAVSGTLWYRNRHNVKLDQIQISLNSPSAFTAGDEITYAINYANNSLENWRNVDVAFEPPPGFTFVSSSKESHMDGKRYVFTLGNVRVREKGSIEVKGFLLGELNTSVVAQATIRITPENFPSGKFDKQALSTTTITTVPIDLAIDLAREATKGQRLVATIKVTNTSSNAINNLLLKINPNPGMQLLADDPEFSEGFSLLDAQWQIPSITSLQTLTYKAVVVIDGQPKEQRILEVKAGIKPQDTMYVQRDLSSTVTIVSSDLSVEQSYNDSKEPIVAAAGGKVVGEIKYANTGTTGLTDVIVRAKFEGGGFDPATLKLESGAYDPNTQTITWTAASIPQLAVLQPQASGSIKYEFAIHKIEDFPKDKETKNNAVIITTSIDSPSIITPEGEATKVVSDRFIISITSDLTLQADAFYDDGRLGINSTGPLPPEVGQQTTYTARLRLGTTLNDTGNVRVSIILPDGVTYTGQKVSTVGDVSFNERSQELSWTMPQLAGQTGRTSPPAELDFQVAITPGENQRGSEVDLLQQASVIGTDLFTNKEIQASISSQSLPTTETASKDQGKVQ